MKNITERLKQAKPLLQEAADKIAKLEHDNENLKLMLWRMVQKHGSEMMKGSIDDKTYKEVMESEIYFDDDMNIKFGKPL